MGIGSKLSELMSANDTNANELAKKIGVSPQTIYSIVKRDSKKADIDVLIRIAKNFGVTVEYFVDDINSTAEAAHKDGENFTPDELQKIEEYKKLLIAARPKE